MGRHIVWLWSLAAWLVWIALGAALAVHSAMAQSQPCVFSGGQVAAFCDSLVVAASNGPDIRSGDLDGVVWGVSRGTSADAVFQGGFNTWFAPDSGPCNPTPFNSPNDVKVCNGQLTDTVKDGGASLTLGMYPRQPFDIAGRTGTVVFDLSADGLCNHCAWPVFEYTDQPVPAPSSFSTAMPRNGFGFTLYQVGVCPTGQTGVGDMAMTQNYTNHGITFNHTGCVLAGSAGGALNHFEVRMSPTHVEVWGSDPGGANFHQLATADVALPLTRGLVWMEDTHYNANKDSTQGTHTFAWANFGFDGPVLPRDLGFDVKDFESGFTGDARLGYLCNPTCNISINNVHGIPNAAAALLEFTWTPQNNNPLTYSLNGNPSHTFAWPYADNQTFTLRTIAIPVALSELVAGTNSLSISTGGPFDLANIDLILAGAGGNPLPVSTPTVTPTVTVTPTATVTPTVTPTAAATNTPVPTATSTAVPTATQTMVVPTATATPRTCTISIDANGVVSGRCQ